MKAKMVVKAMSMLTSMQLRPRKCKCWAEKLVQMSYIRLVRRSMRPMECNCWMKKLGPTLRRYIKLVLRSMQLKFIKCNCWVEKLDPGQMGHIRRVLIKQLKPMEYIGLLLRSTSPIQMSLIRLLLRSMQLTPMECNCWMGTRGMPCRGILFRGSPPQ